MLSRNTRAKRGGCFNAGHTRVVAIKPRVASTIIRHLGRKRGGTPHRHKKKRRAKDLYDKVRGKRAPLQTRIISKEQNSYKTEDKRQRKVKPTLAFFFSLLSQLNFFFRASH